MRRDKHVPVERGRDGGIRGIRTEVQLAAGPVAPRTLSARQVTASSVVHARPIVRRIVVGAPSAAEEPSPVSHEGEHFTRVPGAHHAGPVVVVRPRAAVRYRCVIAEPDRVRVVALLAQVAPQIAPRCSLAWEKVVGTARDHTTLQVNVHRPVRGSVVELDLQEITRRGLEVRRSHLEVLRVDLVTVELRLGTFVNHDLRAIVQLTSVSVSVRMRA